MAPDSISNWWSVGVSAAVGLFTLAAVVVALTQLVLERRRSNELEQRRQFREESSQARSVRHDISYVNDSSGGIAIESRITNHSLEPIYDLVLRLDAPLEYAEPRDGGIIPRLDRDSERSKIFPIKKGDSIPRTPTATLYFRDSWGKSWNRTATGDLTIAPPPEFVNS